MARRRIDANHNIRGRRCQMEVPEGAKAHEFKDKNTNKSRGELVVVIPFFIFSIAILLASIGYRKEASLVPVLSGITGLILSGMRLFYLLFPQYGIGEFKQGGLAKEFDDMRDEIEEELHLKSQEEESEEISLRDEMKAFIYLIACFLIFLLFGYLIGVFFVITVCCYFYDYRDKLPIIVSLISMYLIVYIILYKLLGAPADFGLILEPLLRSYTSSKIRREKVAWSRISSHLKLSRSGTT
jgi:hypothetical protein